MKPKLLDRRSQANHSFDVHHHLYPHFLKIWHYHPELELVYIKQGTGTRFVGDSIKKFQPGDLVLIGEDLPHMWQSDSLYFQEGCAVRAEALVIHFSKDFAGKEFLNTPELIQIKELVERAKSGLHFNGECNAHIGSLLEEIIGASDVDRLILLLQILRRLADEKSAQSLSSPGFADSFNRIENRRLDKIYGFLLSNYKDDITLNQVADMIGMNVSSFCRYFKKTTGRTFSHYLNEIRIGVACRLLMESTYNISETCFACGYNNISNFNRQFKTITKMSPSAYAKLHRSL